VNLRSVAIGALLIGLGLLSFIVCLWLTVWPRG
jgi:hypothetical protein